MRMKADILGDKDSVAAVELYDKAADIVMKTKGRPDIAMMWNSSLHLLRTTSKEDGVLGVRFCKRSWYDGTKLNTTSQSIARGLIKTKTSTQSIGHWLL